MCRLSWNLGISTSWNPQGLSRPVMGLLFLFFLPCSRKPVYVFPPEQKQPSTIAILELLRKVFGRQYQYWMTSPKEAPCSYDCQGHQNSEILRGVFTWRTARYQEPLSMATCRMFERRHRRNRYSCSYRTWRANSRLQLKWDGTRWRKGGEVKGKLANGVCSQYPSHYLGTWCIQHYYRWCAQPGCQ